MEENILKQLKIEQTVLKVNNVYPYRYDYGKGKEVLRIEISEEQHSFAEIKEVLEDCTSTIKYFENDEFKIDYEDYSLDFNCQYNNGIYSIEITRISQQERDIETLNGAILDIAEMLGGE